MFYKLSLLPISQTNDVLFNSSRTELDITMIYLTISLRNCWATWFLSSDNIKQIFKKYQFCVGTKNDIQSLF